MPNNFFFSSLLAKSICVSAGERDVKIGSDVLPLLQDINIIPEREQANNNLPNKKRLLNMAIIT
jgi:hypothetical protein